MSEQSYLEMIEELGPIPGLLPWQKEQVLLVRSGDISTQVFAARIAELTEKLEALHIEAQPETMQPESYALAESYYRIVSEALDLYLLALEELEEWSVTGDASLLESSRQNFALGDDFAHRATLEAIRLEEQYRAIDEELLRAAGVDWEGKGRSSKEQQF